MSHSMTEEQEGEATAYAQKFNDLVAQRAVRTHDTHGISYSEGNRATRRARIKNRGTSQPKQWHKQGHKLG